MYRFRIMLCRFYLYKNDNNNKQKKPVGWASLLME